MRRAFVILVAVAALAAIIVATAPASLAGVAVEHVTGGVLILADSDGTIWRGRGTLLGARAVRMPLAWSIDPWPLLRRELRLHVVPSTATGRSPRAEITARGESIALRELDVLLPAGIVESLAPRSGVRVTGDVRISAASLDWTPSSFRGGARLDWLDAQLDIANDAGIRLGTVTAVLTATADRLVGPVTSDGGNVDVRGMLAISATGAPEMSITMTPRGGEPAQARTLSLTGGPGATGLNLEIRAGVR